MLPVESKETEAGQAFWSLVRFHNPLLVRSLETWGYNDRNLGTLLTRLRTDARLRVFPDDALAHLSTIADKNDDKFITPLVPLHLLSRILKLWKDLQTCVSEEEIEKVLREDDAGDILTFDIPEFAALVWKTPELFFERWVSYCSEQFSAENVFGASSGLSEDGASPHLPIAPTFSDSARGLDASARHLTRYLFEQSRGNSSEENVEYFNRYCSKATSSSGFTHVLMLDCRVAEEMLTPIEIWEDVSPAVSPSSRDEESLSPQKTDEFSQYLKELAHEDDDMDGAQHLGRTQDSIANGRATKRFAVSVVNSLRISGGQEDLRAIVATLETHRGKLFCLFGRGAANVFVNLYRHFSFPYLCMLNEDFRQICEIFLRSGLRHFVVMTDLTDMESQENESNAAEIKEKSFVGGLMKTTDGLLKTTDGLLKTGFNLKATDGLLKAGFNPSFNLKSSFGGYWGGRKASNENARNETDTQLHPLQQQPETSGSTKGNSGAGNTTMGGGDQESAGQESLDDSPEKSVGKKAEKLMTKWFNSAVTNWDTAVEKASEAVTNFDNKLEELTLAAVQNHGDYGNWGDKKSLEQADQAGFLYHHTLRKHEGSESGSTSSSNQEDGSKKNRRPPPEGSNTNDVDESHGPSLDDVYGALDQKEIATTSVGDNSLSTSEQPSKESGADNSYQSNDMFAAAATALSGVTEVLPLIEAPNLKDLNIKDLKNDVSQNVSQIGKDVSQMGNQLGNNISKFWTSKVGAGGGIFSRSGNASSNSSSAGDDVTIQDDPAPRTGPLSTTSVSPPSPRPPMPTEGGLGSNHDSGGPQTASQQTEYGTLATESEPPQEAPSTGSRPPTQGGTDGGRELNVDSANQTTSSDANQTTTAASKGFMKNLGSHISQGLSAASAHISKPGKQQDNSPPPNPVPHAMKILADAQEDDQDDTFSIGTDSDDEDAKKNKKPPPVTTSINPNRAAAGAAGTNASLQQQEQYVPEAEDGLAGATQNGLNAPGSQQKPLAPPPPPPEENLAMTIATNIGAYKKGDIIQKSAYDKLVNSSICKKFDVTKFKAPNSTTGPRNSVSSAEIPLRADAAGGYVDPSQGAGTSEKKSLSWWERAKKETSKAAKTATQVAHGMVAGDALAFHEKHPRVMLLCLNHLMVVSLEKTAKTHAEADSLNGNGVAINILVHSCRRIQSIRRLSFEETDPQRMQIEYKDKARINIYHIDNHQGFMQALRSQLQSLNIGMKPV